MATVTESAPEMTLADLIEKFGPIPIRRIRQDPEPGTATEDDVVAISEREDRLRSADTLTGDKVLPGFEVRVGALLAPPEPPAPPR